MRAGAYTIHQSLTAEAAAVLKLALALARRRGHAQVTPLHVAFALLTGPAATASCAQPLAAAFSSASSSPAAPYGLLKRACLRSHPSPGAAASSPAQQHHHPLQCRALELCFNVALNRLPTSGPHSPPAAHFASPLIQPSPTLSNALVAALKRAQANQRRGCVELQQPPPPPPPVTAQQQQPQPLLAIKVELDQLVISILDDPSVSRVMREAGFSSATVKSNLEEESALMPPPSSSSSSPPPPPPPIPPHFFLDPSIAAGGGGRGGGGRFALWPSQFLAAAPGPDACSDDVRAVLEVMVRRQGRRGGGNPVVVGDSVSMAEAVAGELLRRLERGDVPAELAGAHLLKLQLSYVHVRLMSRADVDARAAELRRSVDAVQPQRGGGLVVYVGDLRWALDEEPNPSEHATASSYSPVEHMVAELGRLLDDLRTSRGRSWLVATASYQTYMRWQQRRRRPPTESAAWALQAVVVPTGSGTGLALNSLHPSTPSSSSSLPSASAAPVPPAMATAHQLGQSPFVMAAGETTGFAAAGDDQDETHLLLCTECSKNYEREASLVKAEAGAEGPRGSLPAWLVPDRPPVDQTPHHKEKYLMELKRKWSRLCRKLHLCAVDPCSAPCPWWSGSCLLPGSQSKPTVAGFLGLDGLMELGKSRTSQWPPSPLPRWGLTPVMAPGCQGAGTALALGSHPLSDSATSGGRAPGSGDGSAAVRELERRLRRNIPWQPVSVVAEIVETALAGRGPVWLYVKGSDHAAARRAAAVIAEARCGSSDRVVLADPSRFSCAEELCSDVVSRASEIGGQAFVVVVDDVENAPCDVVDCLVAASERGRLKDHQSGRELDLSSSVVILTTSKFTGAAGSVIGLRLWSEDEAPPGGALKRKTVSSPQGECKRARHDALDLNLNLCAEEDTDEEDDDGSDDDEEAVPSDITHEGDSGDSSEHGHPHGLLESIAARVVTLDEEGGHDALAAIRARLAGAIAGHGRSRVDEAAVQALAAASGEFLEEVLERWTAEVLGPAAATVRNGGKGKEVVVLGLGPVGGARETEGFMGSVLPSRVHVD
ncbi:hypothetical protein SEVIR_7G049800v4 [Setaria viridis]|uniref:Clp R domain-containing protein n=1 Tax=Setaria viridis TaxID=4556 RepID=A0A4U6TQC4_SETVI|nr:protein SMAX1-LIKE 4 [Setaria viridis]TKW03565.1 hypothetical protein SEVIR_7G049800v2 [Setaria viridis]